MTNPAPVCPHCDQPIAGHDVQECGRRISESVEEERVRRARHLSDDAIATARAIQAEADEYHRLVYQAELDLERRQGLR